MTKITVAAVAGVLLFTACMRQARPSIQPTPARPAVESPRPVEPAATTVAPTSVAPSVAAPTAPLPATARSSEPLSARPADSSRTADSATVTVSGKRTGDLFGDSVVVAAPRESAGPSWDIDVRSYESESRVEHYVHYFSGPAKERIESRLQVVRRNLRALDRQP